MATGNLKTNALEPIPNAHARYPGCPPPLLSLAFFATPWPGSSSGTTGTAASSAPAASHAPPGTTAKRSDAAARGTLAPAGSAAALSTRAALSRPTPLLSAASSLGSCLHGGPARQVQPMTRASAAAWSSVHPRVPQGTRHAGEDGRARQVCAGGQVMAISAACHPHSPVLLIPVAQLPGRAAPCGAAAHSQPCH